MQSSSVDFHIGQLKKSVYVARCLIWAEDEASEDPKHQRVVRQYALKGFITVASLGACPQTTALMVTSNVSSGILVELWSYRVVALTSVCECEHVCVQAHRKT